MPTPRLTFLLPLLWLTTGCREEATGAAAGPAASPAPATATATATEKATSPAPAIPPEAAAALQRGRAAYARRDLSAAIAELEQVVALAPGWAEGHRSLGKLLFSTSTVWFSTPIPDPVRLERAIQSLLAAHELEPSHADGAFWAGRALALAKRGPEAEAMLLEALRLDPAHGLACKELGLHWASLGEVERAKAQLLRAAELRPADDEVRCQLGLQLEAEGDVAGAIDQQLRALALNPALPGPRARLISLYQRLGKAEEADRMAAEVPRWAAFGESVRSATKLYDASPNAPAALAVAELYRAAEMRVPAREWLEVVLQHDPKHEAAQLLRDELGPPPAHEATAGDALSDAPSREAEKPR